MMSFSAKGANGPQADAQQEDIVKSKILGSIVLFAPPGSGGGNVAKADDSAITDEEIEQLKAAKLMYGDVEAQWRRMTGECIGRREGPLSSFLPHLMIPRLYFYQHPILQLSTKLPRRRATRLLGRPRQFQRIHHCQSPPPRSRQKGQSRGD